MLNIQSSGCIYIDRHKEQRSHYVGSDKPWLEIKTKQEKVLTDHVDALDNGIKSTQKDVHGNSQLFFWSVQSTSKMMEASTLNYTENPHSQRSILTPQLSPPIGAQAGSHSNPTPSD